MEIIEACQMDSMLFKWQLTDQKLEIIAKSQTLTGKILVLIDRINLVRIAGSQVFA
ncbi:hypothetical protein AAK899_02500 [Erysipelotrichaceae bacterium 51-3]